MRRGHIHSVEFLEAGSDADSIEQGKTKFHARKDEGFDAFEIWDGARPVYRYPDDPSN
jgi:hypothetical protein